MQEIYRLTSTIGFSPEYVESMIPMERNLYISYYIEDSKRESQKVKGEYDVLSDNIPAGINMQGTV